MTGQYYQQPPEPRTYGMVQPEVNSTKDLVRIAGIISIVFGIIYLIIGVFYVLLMDSMGIAFIGGWIGLIFMAITIIDFILYLNCMKINELLDARNYEKAKSKTMVWMIIGFLFGAIPGIILLIAYLNFDKLIGVPQGPGYMPAPPQTRTCMGCGQQVPVSYNNCPHCGKQMK